MNGNAGKLGNDPGMAWRDLIPATDCRMATLKSLPHTKRAPSQPNDLFRVHIQYVAYTDTIGQALMSPNTTHVFFGNANISL